MKEQLVSEWMTHEVISVSPDRTVPEAIRIMKEYEIRRLPVVDEDGRLIGIVTQGDLQQASPSDATTLSLFELNYLLAKLPVRDVMTREPITVTPITRIAHAAQLMLEHKIGGLPVLEHGKLTGIITESDIFRMLVLGNVPAVRLGEKQEKQ
jgi:CBS domain-containing protein